MDQERRASISVRLAAKTAAGHGGQTAHDLRKAADLDYVDYSRSPRNSILIKPATGPELKAICEERRNMRETKRRMKSNARVAFEGIVTFSKLAQPIIEALPLNEQDAIFHQVAEKIAKHLNTTLHGLVVHRDESAVHAHFVLAGYDFINGRPLTQAVKRQQCREIQDVAAEVVTHLGIERGKSKIERIKDGEPLNAIINRQVKELHHDLPTEIEALKQRIAELEERERKASERLAKTLAKLERTQDENERLQKRLETYQRRLESVQKELEQAQTEIERLRQLAEPFKPQPTEIDYVTGWKETGIGPLRRREPTLNSAKVVTVSDMEKALIATRKAAEIEARRKAEQAVQDELNRLRQRNQELERNREQLTSLVEAIKEASDQFGLTSAEPDPDEAIWLEEKTPPELRYYNATLLDYETRIVAVGDGSPLQQAAALYRAAREKGWERTIFWGMNEAQIEWLVKAAEKDGYEIDFKTEEAREIAERVRQELTHQYQSSNGHDLEM